MAPLLNVLMVAEKPSIADSIAHALSSNIQKHNGKTPIHEFQAKFQGKDAQYRVTSVTGHINSCDFPPQYSSWDAVDPSILFTAPVMKKVETQGIVRQLQTESKNVDVLVLWLDCDREGENICFEVIDIVKPNMKKNKDGNAEILRAKFSAVTKSDILKAIQNLGEPNENESLSVDARQELDLKVGVSFSRFQTKYFQGKYGDLDSSLVSYGPCQTPTLGFCIDRHDEIQQFQPEPFWTLDLNMLKNGHKIALEWERGRLFDHEACCTFLNIVQDVTFVTVEEIKKSEVSRSRPIPLNTVNLLQFASKGLNMGPFTTMQVAERLYLQGYISYPRTESTSYPDSYDIKYALTQHQNNQSWGSYVSNLLASGYQKPKNGVDAGDHPPITPVRTAQPGDLSGDMARLYDLVTRHFLATISPDAKLLATKVKFSCHKEQFAIRGNQVLHLGYTEILSSTSLMDEYLPEFVVHEKLPIAELKLRNGQTSPPGYLTESELISLMEKHKIGTDASIPAHINNICERNYVTLEKGRTLVPTNLGIVLVHGYYRTDPELVLPKVRAAIEEQCTLIAKGQATKEEVLKHTLNMFKKKFDYFVAKIQLMDSLFEATFSPLAATGKPLSKCGKCSRYMKYVCLKPQRLHCSTCNETYDLPQNGTIKLYKELRCPLDSFELILFSLGNSEKAMGKTYPLCPYCYNNPPFESIHSKMGCNNCLHTTCKHSLIQNGICLCPNSSNDVELVQSEKSNDNVKKNNSKTIKTGDKATNPNDKNTKSNDNVTLPSAACNGTMVLDVNSKPNWKICCNSCQLILKFEASIHSIKVLHKLAGCEECDSTLIEIEFHKEKSPLKQSESNVYGGCIVCDPFLSDLLVTKMGRFKHVKLSVNRRRKGKHGRSHHHGKRGNKKNENVLLSFENF